MPVILRPGEAFDRWLSADGAEAAAMQVALADDLMREIAGPESGPKSGPEPQSPQASLF